MWKNNT